jgi:beta-phosphoglucomutase
MMIKAIIFDMDGVLIDAKEWHYEALNRALNLFGYEINRFDHLTRYDGLPTRQKLKMLTIERGFPEGLHAFVNEVKQLYTMEIVHASCKPRFAQEYALSKLKSKGFRLGVASNSVRSTVEVMMQKSSLVGYLDVMFSNEDVAKPKPDSEIYTKAFSVLGLDPSEVLVVEDNENGIKAAKASGANVMEVKGVEEVNYENIMSRLSDFESGENQ